MRIFRIGRGGRGARRGRRLIPIHSIHHYHLVVRQVFDDKAVISDVFTGLPWLCGGSALECALTTQVDYQARSPRLRPCICLMTPVLVDHEYIDLRGFMHL